MEFVVLDGGVGRKVGGREEFESGGRIKRTRVRTSDFWGQGHVSSAREEEGWIYAGGLEEDGTYRRLGREGEDWRRDGREGELFGEIWEVDMVGREDDGRGEEEDTYTMAKREGDGKGRSGNRVYLNCTDKLT